MRTKLLILPILSCFLLSSCDEGFKQLFTKKVVKYPITENEDDKTEQPSEVLESDSQPKSDLTNIGRYKLDEGVLSIYTLGNDTIYTMRTKSPSAYPVIITVK